MFPGFARSILQDDLLTEGGNLARIIDQVVEIYACIGVVDVYPGRLAPEPIEDRHVAEDHILHLAGLALVDLAGIDRGARRMDIVHHAVFEEHVVDQRRPSGFRKIAQFLHNGERLSAGSLQHGTVADLDIADIARCPPYVAALGAHDDAAGIVAPDDAVGDPDVVDIAIGIGIGTHLERDAIVVSTQHAIVDRGPGDRTQVDTVAVEIPVDHIDVFNGHVIGIHDAQAPARGIDHRNAFDPEVRIAALVFVPLHVDHHIGVGKLLAPMAHLLAGNDAPACNRHAVAP